MKKLTILFALLTLSVGLWATTQKVSYRYPVYIDNDATKGIKEWKTGSVTATVVDNEYYSVTWNASWYVVTGEDVQLESGAICNGDVHLILADGAKLTIESSYAGIQVSGDDNSLTIYAQSTDPATMGQLIVTGGAAGIGGNFSVTGNGEDGSNITINGGIVNATGKSGAGIGGGSSPGSYVGGKGSNITINGGIVTATGNAGGSAGIGGAKEGGSGSDITINGGTVTANGGNIGGAGIGSGYGGGSGSNITINGGTVTANGGNKAAGIGGGCQGSGSNITITDGEVTANGGDHASGIGAGSSATNYSNITVATTHIVTADGNNPPTTEITNNGGDLASSLREKRYVKIEVNLKLFKDAAIAAISDAIEGVTDEGILAIANKAKEDINKATTREDIDAIKDKALIDISLFPQKDAAITEITTAREGIQNENLNNWIDAAIDDIQKGGPDATPGIDEIKDQILTIINFFKDGKAEGQAALGNMATPCTGCTAVEVTDGTTTVKLYNATGVDYVKVPSEE